MDMSNYPWGISGGLFTIAKPSNGRRVGCPFWYWFQKEKLNYGRKHLLNTPRRIISYKLIEASKKSNYNLHYLLNNN